MKVALDSNAYSDWRRSARWEDEITTAQEVMVGAVVLGELRYGFRQGNKVKENEARLMGFLRLPIVRVLDVNEETSRHYAVLKGFLRSSGRMIPENDIWIGSLALQHDLRLLTSDRHFEALPQVRVQWPED